ncbi:MAG: hypothetical protein H6760_04175 [Candidatus Nomurabacteria bacterium]|nr:MAG: hypothetical protein H6760_04175 [Candidatus Nomurabacteria bacterium]
MARTSFAAGTMPSLKGEEEYFGTQDRLSAILNSHGQTQVPGGPELYLPRSVAEDRQVPVRGNPPNLPRELDHVKGIMPIPEDVPAGAYQIYLVYVDPGYSYQAIQRVLARDTVRHPALVIACNELDILVASDELSPYWIWLAFGTTSAGVSPADVLHTLPRGAVPLTIVECMHLLVQYDCRELLSDGAILCAGSRSTNGTLPLLHFHSAFPFRWVRRDQPIKHHPNSTLRATTLNFFTPFRLPLNDYKGKPGSAANN